MSLVERLLVVAFLTVFIVGTVYLAAPEVCLYIPYFPGCGAK